MYHLNAEQEIVRRYAAGETAASIGESFGVGYQVIQRRLKRAGVPLRGRGPTVAGRLKISAAQRLHLDENLLRELASAGLSTREIADSMPENPSQECVRERMIELGIPRLAAKARPEKNHFWQGGMTVDTNGYILVKVPAHPHRNSLGYVRAHRLIVEQELGRLLEPHEVVDHRNGDKSDNRIENLQLFGSNADHLRETLVGVVRLAPSEREKLRRQAVQLAKWRVTAILAESKTDAGQ